MHDLIANELLLAVRQLDATARRSLQVLRSLERQGKEQVALQRAILHHLNPASRVIGGTFHQIPQGDSDMSTSLVPIQAGNTPKFQVTPTFSGPAFTLDGSKAAISTSDPVNAAASIDLTDDPTGATFVIALSETNPIPAGGEGVNVDWSYTNEDGTVAHVTGTLTEQGIVDDVTGGTFEQIS